MDGVDLYTVKELMGHQSTKMTERYAHLSLERRHDAVQRLNAKPSNTKTHTRPDNEPEPQEAPAQATGMDRKRARPAGFEPATTGLEGRCSIRLSYGRVARTATIQPRWPMR